MSSCKSVWRTGQNHVLLYFLPWGAVLVIFPIHSVLGLGVFDKFFLPEMGLRSHLHGLPLQTNEQGHLYLFLCSKDSRCETGTAVTLLRMLLIAQAVSAKTCFSLLLISFKDCPPHYEGRSLGGIVYSVQVPPLVKPSSGWITPVPMCVPLPVKILKKRE